MKAMSVCVAAALVLGSLAAGTAAADVLTVTPAQAVVLPADGSGLTKVALLFDLSALRQGEGRQIDEALLDWKVAGVPADRQSNYTAYAVTAAWSAEGAAGSGLSAVSEAPAAKWRVEILDYERNNGGFVRLNLTELAADWASGAKANYGIVVVTPDVSRQALADQLGGARLTVRYGFRRQ